MRKIVDRLQSKRWWDEAPFSYLMIKIDSRGPVHEQAVSVDILYSLLHLLSLQRASPFTEVNIATSGAKQYRRMSMQLQQGMVVIVKSTKPGAKKVGVQCVTAVDVFTSLSVVQTPHREHTVVLRRGPTPATADNVSRSMPLF